MSNTIGSSGKKAQFRLADDLLPGDILLSADPESFQSEAIRFGTRGSFSHGAIYSGELTFVEAIDEGVVIFNHGRFGIAKRENVRVLRLDDENAQEIGRRAALAAEEYLEREYWTPGALRSALRLDSASPKGAMFCSFLVARSYADAGVELCPGLPPNLVTPADIERSPRLKDISNVAIVPLDHWDHRSDLLDSNHQSRSRKSGQDDKWNFCLITAIVAVNRRDHEQTTPPEPLTGLQGEGGAGRRQGRPNHRTAGGAFRRSS
jgi:hypothetical protein